MALAVARSVEHETWSWPDPEVGAQAALRGLGAFSVLVGAGSLIGWAASLWLGNPEVNALLLAAAATSLAVATACLVGAMVVQRRARRRAPCQVRVGSARLAWADRTLTWDRVRTIGVVSRTVERGRVSRCVVVLDDHGVEVWLAVDQPDEALEQLDRVLREAWTDGTTGGPGSLSGQRFRVIEGGVA